MARTIVLVAILVVCMLAVSASAAGKKSVALCKTFYFNLLPMIFFLNFAAYRFIMPVT
jgi:hypothetical protein